jgi:hypothetical protein
MTSTMTDHDNRFAYLVPSNQSLVVAFFAFVVFSFAPFSSAPLLCLKQVFSCIG